MNFAHKIYYNMPYDYKVKWYVIRKYNYEFIS